MRISGIVAIAANRVMGKDNQLPWQMPADLRHFKKITMGKPILLGRKTYLSIGKPLPGRLNVVITRDFTFQAPGCVVVHSIEEALSAVSTYDEIFVIGGAELFQQMLPNITRWYVTEIHQSFAGDVFFPVLNPAEWQEVERQDCSADPDNVFAYSFLILDRK